MSVRFYFMPQFLLRRTSLPPRFFSVINYCYYTVRTLCKVADIFQVANRKKIKLMGQIRMPIPSNRCSGKCVCTLVRNSLCFVEMRCLKFCLVLGNVCYFTAVDYHSALLLIISATLLCLFSFIRPFLCLAIPAFCVFVYLRHITHYPLTEIRHLMLLKHFHLKAMML
jgi:hypothetical protein